MKLSPDSSSHLLGGTPSAASAHPNSTFYGRGSFKAISGVVSSIRKERTKEDLSVFGERSCLRRALLLDSFPATSLAGDQQVTYTRACLTI
jgi:hypothetical protein